MSLHKNESNGLLVNEKPDDNDNDNDVNGNGEIAFLNSEKEEQPLQSLQQQSLLDQQQQPSLQSKKKEEEQNKDKDKDKDENRNQGEEEEEENNNKNKNKNNKKNKKKKEMKEEKHLLRQRETAIAVVPIKRANTQTVYSNNSGHDNNNNNNNNRWKTMIMPRNRNTSRAHSSFNVINSYGRSSQSQPQLHPNPYQHRQQQQQQFQQGQLLRQQQQQGLEDNITLEDIQVSNQRYKFLLVFRYLLLFLLIVLYFILFQLIQFLNDEENQVINMHVKVSQPTIPLPLIYIGFPLKTISVAQVNRLFLTRDSALYKEIDLSRTSSNSSVVHLDSMNQYLNNISAYEDKWVVVHRQRVFDNNFLGTEFSSTTPRFLIDENIIIRPSSEQMGQTVEGEQQLDTITLEVRAIKDRQILTNDNKIDHIAYISSKGIDYQFFWGLASLRDFEENRFSLSQGSAELMPWASSQYRTFDFSYLEDDLTDKTNHFYSTTAASGYYDDTLILEVRKATFNNTQYSSIIAMFPDWNTIQVDYVNERKYTWSTIMASVGGFFSAINGVLAILVVYLGSGYDFENECRTACCRNEKRVRLCNRFCGCCVQFQGIAPQASIPRLMDKKHTEMWARERELIGLQVTTTYLDQNMNTLNARIDKLAEIFGFDPDDLE